jgi:hypothetical protein
MHSDRRLPIAGAANEPVPNAVITRDKLVHLDRHRFVTALEVVVEVTLGTSWQSDVAGHFQQRLIGQAGTHRVDEELVVDDRLSTAGPR